MNSEKVTVCGNYVQYDKSGVGHCWVSVSREEIPSNIVEELEGEMIDGGMSDSGECIASNGIHYSW